MIYGIGTDIVQISRIEHILTKNKAVFVSRILTEHEAHLFANRGDCVKFLAKRFAAKEAFAKALGTGIGAVVSFQDLTVKNDENGKPFFIPSENLRLKLLDRNIKKAHLSLSDEKQNAIAFVVIELKFGADKKSSGIGSF